LDELQSWLTTNDFSCTLYECM